MSEEETMDGLRGKKAAYHGGFAYLERIDGILRALDGVTIPDPDARRYYCLLNGLSVHQHSQRLALLKVLFHELHPKMDNNMKKNHAINQQVTEKHFKIAESQMKQGKAEISGIFIKSFDEWERLLRDFVEEKGLLMPSSKDGLDAAGGE